MSLEVSPGYSWDVELPQEFVWIEPGVKANYKKGGVYTIETLPYLFNYGHRRVWVCTVEEADPYFECKNLEPYSESITLELTIEQAQDLLKFLREKQDRYSECANISWIVAQLGEELGE